jgi:hypothetical protein
MTAAAIHALLFLPLDDDDAVDVDVGDGVPTPIDVPVLVEVGDEVGVVKVGEGREVVVERELVVLVVVEAGVVLTTV